MEKTTSDDVGIAQSSLRMEPTRAPRGLERLATACLDADAQDSRLGDMSERYVRTYRRLRACLGNSSLAMSASCLAADARYLLTAAHVGLLARTVDRGVRPAQPRTRETVALDLRERTMSLLHSAARKLVLPALLLVAGAFLINGAVNVWTTWRETETLMAGLQRGKAEAAAAQIDQHIALLQSQIAWAATERGASAPTEQLRYEFLRLLRQVPAIVEITQLSAEGKEVLKVSRLVKDTVESGNDFSADVRYTEALKRKSYVGPVYFNDRSEPFVSMAIAPARPNAGVTLAEVNVKRLREIIDAIRIGKSGYAYLVDAKGRLIAARGKESVSGPADVSSLPQVAAASAGAPSQGVTYDRSIAGPGVLSTHASVPTTQWQVFVELPLAEARAPLWSASARAASLLGLGLLAILLASLAARREVHMQAART